MSLPGRFELRASRLLREHTRIRLSARWSVVAIVALILIPTLALMGWLAMWLARSERLQLEKSAVNQTREVGAAIEREIVNTQNLLTSLASSPFLKSARMKDFYDQAADLTQKIGVNVVLRDLEAGNEIFNTAFPWEKSPKGAPTASTNPTDVEALQAGGRYVSDIFFAQRTDEFLIAVVVPVFLDGKLSYTVASEVPLTRFADIVQSLDIHPDHLVTVIDRSGIIVTRSDRHSEFAGTLIRTALPIGTQMIGRSVNREGIPFHWFNRQSAVTGWYISVGIPDAVFEAPSRRAGLTFAVAGGLLLAFAIGLSYRWGGHLALSAGALGIEREPTREEFEVLFEAAPNGVLVAGRDGTIMLVNKRLVQKFGYRKGELIGQSIEVLIPDRYRGCHPLHRSDFSQQPIARPMGAGRELYGKRKDNSEFPVEIALNPIMTSAGGLVMATIVDISARKLSQDKLSAALRERDELRRRYTQAQESERLRLAHELHDQTGQTLTAVLLELKGVESRAAESERERLRALRKQMEVMGETLHRVAWELRPLSIDEVGLASALSNYLSEWSLRYGITSDFYCRERSLDDLSDEVRTTIYRVVQEALTNIAKHAADATEVSIVVERTEGILRVTIDDNGCGFQPSMHDKSGMRLGIAGMRERLCLIGGELEVESVIDAGTTIFARIPVIERAGQHEG